jgi:hypothetical protein
MATRARRVSLCRIVHLDNRDAKISRITQSLCRNHPSALIAIIDDVFIQFHLK